MTLADDASPEAVPGELHGRPTLRLANETTWVEVLATAGPRIVGLGSTGGPNLLAETPDLGWETPYGRYELVGGHRLWFAPEDPERVAVPDRDGLAVERLAGGLRLVGPVEPATGLVRTIEVRLAPDARAIAIGHELRNDGAQPLDIAPWSITQLPLGGRVLVPHQAAVPGHRVRPNRNLVLWPYTSWEDPRIRIRDGLVTVDAIGGDELKLGTFDESGAVGYLRDGVALICSFEPAAGRPHPDLGCNVEVYCGPRYLELEVLGPLGRLSPGERVQLHERWEVLPLAGGATDERDLGAWLAARSPWAGAAAGRPA